MKVYISGPMTGIPEYNYPAFAEATRRWRDAGHDVVSPAEVGASVTSGEWVDYMRADIAAMLACDAVATLPDWERSRGAALEVHIARALGMPVLNATDIVAAAGAR